jgi:hypothetical protein
MVYIATAQTKKATEPSFDGFSEIWLPFVDTYRTLCVRPPTELRGLLLTIPSVLHTA